MLSTSFPRKPSKDQHCLFVVNLHILNWNLSSFHIKHLGYAGTKDARAITVQTLTMKSVKPGRIIMAQEDLQKSGIYIGNFK